MVETKPIAPKRPETNVTVGMLRDYVDAKFRYGLAVIKATPKVEPRPSDDSEYYEPHVRFLESLGEIETAIFYEAFIDPDFREPFEAYIDYRPRVPSNARAIERKTRSLDDALVFEIHEFLEPIAQAKGLKSELATMIELVLMIDKQNEGKSRPILEIVKEALATQS